MILMILLRLLEATETDLRKQGIMQHADETDSRLKKRAAEFA